MAVTLGLLPLLILAACSDPSNQGRQGPMQSDARFALTNAHVAIPSEDEYPLNLVFVAPSADPIWSDLESVEIPGVQPFAPAELLVNETDVEGDLKLGSLALSLSARSEAVEFSEIALGFGDAASPETRAIGSWRVSRDGAVSEKSAVQQVGAYPLAVDRCGPLSVQVENQGEVDATSVSLGFGVPGAVADAAPRSVDTLAPGEVATATASPRCDDEVADFYVFSPTLSWTADGSQERVFLPPVSVGLMNISEEKISTISAR